MIHANTAGVGELHPAGTRVLREYLAGLERSDFYTSVYPELLCRIEDARLQIATLLGVSDRSIVLSQSTTDALATFLMAFPWKEGDYLVVSRGAFVSVRVLLQQLSRCQHVKSFEGGEPSGLLTVENLACLERTPRLVLVDWVNHISGLRNDVRRLSEWCDEQRVAFVVDGVQGLGAVNVDFDINRITAFASGCHKWLHGPEGTGFLYVNQQFLPELQPGIAGYRALADRDDLDSNSLELTPDARRFEVSTINHLGFAGLASVLRCFQNDTLKCRATRISLLRQAICDVLQSVPSIRVMIPGIHESSAGITSFHSTEIDNRELLDRLHGNGVIAAERGGWVRLSPSADVDADELARRLTRALSDK